MSGQLSRPPWWRPEIVLENLRSGKTIAEQIREAMRELEGRGVIHRPRPPTYRNDLIEWRAKIPGYDADFRAAMQTCYAREDYQGSRSGRPVEFTPQKKEEFLEEMASNGGKFKEACQAVSISPGHVLAVLDEKKARYDPEFSESFQVVEGDRLIEVYEAMFDEALTPKTKDQPARNALILSRVAESRLSYLLNPKKMIEVSANHRHTFELAPEVTQQLASMRKAFAPAAERPVIDVTPRRELAEAKP